MFVCCCWFCWFAPAVVVVCLFCVVVVVVSVCRGWGGGRHLYSVRFDCTNNKR